MECTAATVEKEFCSATYRCTLHRADIIVAVREGSCNTAEKGFQSDRVKRKYSGDFRAAENDIRARAQKRAFVNAMIAACAASDIFAVADEQEIPEGECEVVDEGTEQDPRVPLVEKLLKLVQCKAFTDEDRSELEKWANSRRRTTKQLEEAIEKADDKIARWEGCGALRVDTERRNDVGGTVVRGLSHAKEWLPSSGPYRLHDDFAGGSARFTHFGVSVSWPR
jgi:hypothetical protein